MSDLRHRPIRPPRYLEKVLALAAQVEAGGQQHVSVLHDPWCHLLHGAGGCNCDPDVELVPADDLPPGWRTR